MPDTSSAWIEIGGRIETREALDELTQAILDQGLGPDWGGGYEDTGEVEATLREAAAEGTGAKFFDDQAPGGMFEDLEAKCRELGLSYSRADDGHYSYSCSFVFWEPGMDEERYWTGNNDNNEPHLSAPEIRKLLATPGALEAEVSLMERALNHTFPIVVVPPEQAEDDED